VSIALIDPARSPSSLTAKMRPVLTFGRLCSRLCTPGIRAHIQRRAFGRATNQFESTTIRFSKSKWQARKIFWSAAALSPAAFISLSEKDNNGTELTAEVRMLAASREEMEKRVHDDDRGFTWLRHSIMLFVDLYIWEPLCTGIRFLHLVIIFVPVISAVPAIWMGRRDPKRDNERSGTLWWFKFLVKSMERAGPAFIKVRSDVFSQICY
jgi:aarF domain-containing kinase